MRRLIFATIIILPLAILISSIFFVSFSQALTIGKSPTAISTGLNNGLVGWWTFDGADCDALSCADKSGNGNKASTSSAAGMPKRNRGKVGQSMKFDGSNDYLNAGTSVLSGATAFTAVGWFKTNYNGASQLQTLFSKDDRTDADKKMTFQVQTTSGEGANTLEAYVWDESATAYLGYRVFSNVTNAAWHHVAFTYNGGTTATSVALYVDGVMATATYSGGTFAGIDDTSAPLLLGAYTNSSGALDRLFNGSLDDVRVYNRALSLAEVQQLYKQGGGKISKSPTGITTGLNTGLVGWWTFDGADCDANNCFDKSGNGVTCTKNGTVRSFSGKIGQAASIGLSTDVANNNNYFSCGTTNSPTNITRPPISVSAWVNYNVKGGAKAVIHNSDSNWTNMGYGLTVDNSNRMEFWINTQGVNYARAAITAGKWTHVVGTYDGATIKLYKDGVLAASTAYVTSTIGTSTFATVLGNARTFASSYYFTGKFDDVRVYNRALSLAEVQQLYKQGGGKISKSPTNITTGLNTGLVGWWTFDGADCDALSCTDKSGNGNIATSTASTMPAKVKGKIGQAFKFNGSTQYLNNNSFTQLNSATKATVSIWAKRSAANAIINVGQFQNNNNRFGFDFYLDGNLYVEVANGANTYGAFASNDTLWHHYILVYDGTATGDANITKLYVDGINKTLTLTGPMPTSLPNFASTTFSIGNFNPRFASGSIDDVRIYNRALTQSEITQLYKQGK